MRELIDSASKSQTDLLVVEARGTNGVRHLLLGSVAGGVLNRSPVPVCSLAEGISAVAVFKALPLWGQTLSRVYAHVSNEPIGVRLALRTVHGMNPGMREANDHFIERPPLSSRVQRDRHRRSTAQRRQQQIVGSRFCVGAAIRNRFACDEAMRARRDLLCEPAADPRTVTFVS